MTTYKMSKSRKGWKAEWWEKGKHHSKTFPAEEQRNSFVKNREGARRDFADLRKAAKRAGEYVVRFSKLCVEDQNALLGAFEIVRAAGGGIEELTAAARECAERMGGGITVREAVASHLEEVKRTRSARTAQERAWYLGKLLEDYGDEKLCAMTRGRCKEWVDKGSSLSLRAHRHASLSALLGDCARREWIRENPLLGIQKPRCGRKEEVRIFTAKEAESLLRAAEKSAPKLVPYFAIGLFAGLRPEKELPQLEERDIDLDGKEIYVRRGNAKTGQERSVPISPNLLTWLKVHPVHGRVWFGREAFRKTRVESKVAWTPDAMRHSRASYRLAQTRDPIRTADEMGHDVATLKRHYANRRIPKAECSEFWSIIPSAKASGH